MSEFFIFSNHHQKYFAKNGQKISYKKGHYIVTPMDSNPWVYFLESGTVRISFSCSDGQERLIGYFIPGMTFAQSGSFFDQDSGGLEYVADTNIVVYRIPRQDFLQQITKDMDFNADYVNGLLRNQLYLVDRIVYQGEKRVYLRCVRWLLLMAKFYGVSSEKGSTIGVQMTQDTIANFLNTTRESVSGCFSELKKSGLVSVNHKTITITDLGELRQELNS